MRTCSGVTGRRPESSTILKNLRNTYKGVDGAKPRKQGIIMLTLQ